MRLGGGVLAAGDADWAARLAAFLAALAARRAVVQFRAFCGQGSPFDPHQPAHIVGEIGERDLGRRTGEADGADDQVQAAFLGGEDMLDPGPHLRPRRVAAADRHRHRLAPRFGALELGDQPAPVEQRQVGSRAVGGVRPHPARQIIAVEQSGELAAVVGTAWVTVDLRINPWVRSMPTWFL